MRNVIRTASAVFLAAIAFILCSARPSSAVTVSIDPPDTTVANGSSFYVRVIVDAVTDLRGFQLVYSYDSGSLQFLDFQPGGVLTSSPDGFQAFTLPDVTPPADSLAYDAVIFGAGGSGPGILAFIHLKAGPSGDKPIGCVRVGFRDSHNQETLPTCVGGLVEIAGVTPVRRPTWGAIKVIYR